MKIRLEKPRLRWWDNIKMDLRHRVRGYALDLSGSEEGPWRAVVITVMNFWVPLKVVNFFNTWATINFSRRTLLHVINVL
jgi:hypothetical protein